MRDKEGRVLYVITHEDGFQKIGYSSNPTERLESLQAACPKRLSLLTTIESRECTRVEKLLHMVLEEFNVRGEWFVLPDNVIETLNGLDGLDDDDAVQSIKWVCVQHTLNPSRPQWKYIGDRDG